MTTRTDQTSRRLRDAWGQADPRDEVRRRRADTLDRAAQSIHDTSEGAVGEGWPPAAIAAARRAVEELDTATRLLTAATDEPAGVDAAATLRSAAETARLRAGGDTVATAERLAEAMRDDPNVAAAVRAYARTDRLTHLLGRHTTTGRRAGCLTCDLADVDAAFPTGDES